MGTKFQSTPPMVIDDSNAYKYNDNYQIVNTETSQCIGVEHNQDEADKLCKYLSEYHSVTFNWIRNPVDTVRSAKEIRKDCIRVARRDWILTEVGR